MLLRAVINEIGDHLIAWTRYECWDSANFSLPQSSRAMFLRRRGRKDGRESENSRGRIRPSTANRRASFPIAPASRRFVRRNSCRDSSVHGERTAGDKPAAWYQSAATDSTEIKERLAVPLSSQPRYTHHFLVRDLRSDGHPSLGCERLALNALLLRDRCAANYEFTQNQALQVAGPQRTASQP